MWPWRTAFIPATSGDEIRWTEATPGFTHWPEDSGGESGLLSAM
jgi:hypothetical protein